LSLDLSINFNIIKIKFFLQNLYIKILIFLLKSTFYKFAYYPNSNFQKIENTNPNKTSNLFLFKKWNNSSDLNQEIVAVSLWRVVRSADTSSDNLEYSKSSQDLYIMIEIKI